MERKWEYLIFLSIIIVGGLLFYRIYQKPEKSVCGNGICEIDENCYECPIDCKCEEGQYCSPEKKECVSPLCGNGICEPFETYEDCCDDCGCLTEYEECNKTTHRCEIPKIDMSEEMVKELVSAYFEKKGMKIEEFGLISDTIYKDKPAKSCGVVIKGENWPRLVVVTEDGEVIEMPLT